MRKAFIALVVAIFGVYCWQAYLNADLLTLPGYQRVEVDLLDGKSIEEWRGQGGDESVKRQAEMHRLGHIHKLMREGLLPPGGKDLEASGKVYPAGVSLPAEFYEALAKAAEDGGPRTVALDSPAPLEEIERANYRLRNPMKVGETEYKGGEALTAKVIDQLLKADIKRVAIVGIGQPVAPQPASMAMVILIFLALVAALKGTLWEPLLELIDHRDAELGKGAKLAKENRQRQERIEAEIKGLLAETRKEHLAALAATRRAAGDEAAKIVAGARAQAKAARDEAVAAMDKSIAEAEANLRKEAPALAREIVKTVLGRTPGGRAS